VDERVQSIGIENFSFGANPTVLWDLAGKTGHPIRATITDMGPALLSRLLDLNETQEGILSIASARFNADYWYSKTKVPTTSSVNPRWNSPT